MTVIHNVIQSSGGIELCACKISEYRHPRNLEDHLKCFLCILEGSSFFSLQTLIKDIHCKHVECIPHFMKLTS